MLLPDRLIQEWVEGTPGVTPAMVTDAILPGRGLTADGNDIERGTKLRAYAIANFFHENDLFSQGGLIVCSANRTPTATHGKAWQDPASGEFFQYGIPEAEGYRRILVNEARVPAENIVKQQHSCETVGDIWFGQLALKAALEAQNKSSEDHVVAIAAQANHLTSIMEDITPRVMGFRYIGAVVPEANPEKPDYLGAARYVRRFIAPRLPRQSDKAMSHAIDRRAGLAWQAAMLVGKFKSIPQVDGPASSS